MRPLRAAATALVAVLALSSCDGGNDPTDPTPTAQPSDSSSVPSTTPPTDKPTEPVLPAAATKATEAGARAFITYYWDLINYAQVTGDVKPLKGVSGPNCAGCNAGIAGIRQHYRDGGRVIGGTHQVEIENVTELKTKSQSAFGFEATVFASHDAQTIVASDGTQDQRDPGTDEFTVYLLWVDAERWRLDVMEIQ